MRPTIHDEIIAVLGPGDECHVRGDDVPEESGKKWSNDIWSINAPISERSEIQDHVQWLREFVAPYEEEIRGWISRGAKIDFYLSYACDQDHRGFGLSPECMAVFPRLGIRFEVSIMT